MLPLILSTQSYAWGVPASTESKVLDLARANGVKEATKPTKDYRFAELWVGTHPSGGSTLGGSNASGKTLESWLEQNPEALGTTLAQLKQPGNNSGRLPYIMKVLSIDKPVPLQAHPTADKAGAMHQQQSECPNGSHKPEMAICLISFTAFVGFATFDKLSKELRSIPQLAAVFGDQNVQDYLAAGPEEDKQCARHKALAAMLSQLLLHTAPEEAQQTLAAVLKQLGADVEESGPVLLTAGTQAAQAAVEKEESSAKDSTSNDTSTRPQDAPGSGSSDGPKVPTTGTSSAEFAAEAERLEGPTSGVCTASDLDIALGVITQQCGSGQRDAMSGQRGAMISTAAAAWPDDAAGVLALLLLEDVVLERGQACLIPAGCPHAYICGEILEVQAASNNTIKGGPTSHGEPTDKQGLIDIVTASLTGTAGPTPPSGTLGDPASGKLWEGPPQIVEPTVPGGAAGSQGSSSIEGLLLYQPAVDEFQVWHLVIPGGSKGLDYVMDPGPGVLLVTGGNGNAVAKAGVVKSSALTDETELHPGTALFLPAGSSLHFSGHSTTEALDLWMTTANSRMFAAGAAAQHAAAPQGEAEVS